MFSFLTEDGTLALRLPADEREAFLKRHKTSLCERYGTVMKEYVVVPDRLLSNTAELKVFFESSVAYIASLKPKPTTRKKKTTKADGKPVVAARKATKKK